MIEGIVPVGTVRSAYTVTADTPIQPSLNPHAQARVELDPALADALLGLDGFTHVWLVTWLGAFDRPGAERTELRQTPFLLGATDRPYGIFATRGPRRPNRIGLHLVRLVTVVPDPPVVVFAGVDLVDGTPVLDVKPWVDRFDTPFGVAPRCGWFDDVTVEEGATPAGLRRSRPPGA